MKTYFKFDGFDKMLRNIEKMGKSSKDVAENALKKARDQINNEAKSIT